MLYGWTHEFNLTTYKVVVGFCLILGSVIKHFRYLPWKTAIASVWLTLLPLLQMFSANTMISAQQVSLGLAHAVREDFSSFTFREGMNSLVLKDVTALHTDPTSDTELKQTVCRVFPNTSVHALHWASPPMFDSVFLWFLTPTYHVWADRRWEQG